MYASKNEILDAALLHYNCARAILRSALLSCPRVRRRYGGCVRSHPTEGRVLPDRTESVF